MMRKWHGMVLIVISLLALIGGQTGLAAAGDNTQGSAPFSDIKGHWAAAVIEEMAGKGIVSGFPDGTFRPNDPVKAAEFIRMIFMSLTEKTETGGIWWARDKLKLLPEWNDSFVTDATVGFEAGHPWYENYVSTAKNLGVIRNEYDGRFDEVLTRERAADMVAKLDGWFHGAYQTAYMQTAGPQLFKDFNRIDVSFRLGVTDTALRGIMIGNKGLFNPKAAITRAEALQICNVLANASLRKKPSVDLEGVPYSIVPSPGYGSMTFVFANDEMKRVYDSMADRQNEYIGSTEAATAQLYYYENEDFKDKGFHQIHWFDVMDRSYYADLVVNFEGNAYTLGLGTQEGRMERANPVLSYFLTLIFKDEATLVQNMIKDGISNDRSGKKVDINQTVSGRQVVIYSTGYDFIRIGISAYSDR